MENSESEKRSLSQCHDCDNLCCKYITVKITAPRTIRDFDCLLWQLSHENIKAFRDSTGWYMIIYNSCIYMMGNGECVIYENRPITCREYSTKKCDYVGPILSKASLQFFDSFQSLDNYCKIKFKTWDSRFREKK